MCNSVEEYATQRAIDTAIEVCVDFDKTLEETIKYVTSKFDNASVDYIKSKFILLKKGIIE